MQLPFGSGELPLGYLLGRTHYLLRAAIDDALRPFGLTVQQVSVLVALRFSPGLSGADLARRSAVAPQSMVDAIAQLEARGLIERTPDRSRGRTLQAVLTPRGEELLRACRPAMAAVEERALAALAPDERRQLRDLLARSLASLQQTPAPGSAPGGPARG